MNYQKVPEYIHDLLYELDIKYYDIDYYAYPQSFPSTAGPMGGCGGQSMSAFTIEAYVCDGTGPVLYVCSGMYKFEDSRYEPHKHIRDGWIKITEEN